MKDAAIKARVTAKSVIRKVLVMGVNGLMGYSVIRLFGYLVIWLFGFGGVPKLTISADFPIFGIRLFHRSGAIASISRTNIRGSEVVKSLKVFGIMFLFFANVSFIYMNHYSHPKAFYLWNVLDGAMVFALVGLANGLLYPKLMPTPKATNTADR